MGTTHTQNATPVNGNFKVASDNITKGLPVPLTCARQSTMPPKDTVQQTGDAKNLSYLFNRPGSLQPPHHEQTAQPKSDPFIDVEDSE